MGIHKGKLLFSRHDVPRNFDIFYTKQFFVIIDMALKSFKKNPQNKWQKKPQKPNPKKNKYFMTLLHLEW